MNNAAKALNLLFGDIQNWTGYLLALAGLSTLTMSILQAIKDTTPARRWFQMFRLQAYLREHAAIAKDQHGVAACATTAEAQIVRLSTDGDANAFYDLEIEKMCGQWNAANQIAIDSPHLYPDFFACVAARAAKDDFKLVFERRLPQLIPAHEEAAEPLAEQKERLKTRHDFSEARARVNHQILRTVDAFQISASSRWSWALKIASYAISFVLAETALNLHLSVEHGNAMISAAFAGFLAPVARDLLASLQKLRSN